MRKLHMLAGGELMARVGKAKRLRRQARLERQAIARETLAERAEWMLEEGRAALEINRRHAPPFPEVRTYDARAATISFGGVTIPMVNPRLDLWPC